MFTFLFPPFRLLLWLPLVLFPEFIVVLSKEAGGEMVYSILSRTLTVFYLTIHLLDDQVVLNGDYYRHRDDGVWGGGSIGLEI